MFRKAIWQGCLLAAALIGTAGAAGAHDRAPVRLYAANNLKGALSEIVTAYRTSSGAEVETVFDSSGLIRNRINAGEHADIIASADFIVPESFAADGRAGPVVLFARNQLCALTSPSVSISPAHLLETMLDPNIRIGTSTPTADPGGDYVWEAFQKADRFAPGAFAQLDRKAARLIHGPGSPPVPAGSEPMSYWVETGRVDIFLYYCTAAIAAQRRTPQLKVVPFPAELAVVAEYGLTVLHSEPDREARAAQLALYLLSSGAQATLRKYGFIASGVAQSASAP
jgi:ABC-type molybdate transport system substrate-binding protein